MEREERDWWKRVGRLRGREDREHRGERLCGRKGERSEGREERAEWEERTDKALVGLRLGPLLGLD